jgi:hypothetical protein
MYVITVALLTNLKRQHMQRDPGKTLKLASLHLGFNANIEKEFIATKIDIQARAVLQRAKNGS